MSDFKTLNFGCQDRCHLFSNRRLSSSGISAHLLIAVGQPYQARGLHRVRIFCTVTPGGVQLAKKTKLKPNAMTHNLTDISAPKASKNCKQLKP